jgi:hypothetical protein
MGVFKKLLGLDSLKCPKALFVHQHVVCPIFSEGIRLIFSKVIILVTCLGSWTLLALVIAFRFLLNFRPFLLEMIGVNNLGPLPFQAHLRSRNSFFLRGL